MKQLSTLLSLVVLTQGAFAQSECADGRYTQYDRFDSVKVTLAVPFGSNAAVAGGAPQTLYMDVYEPYGDTLSARPVVVVAFGGSFVAGARGDVADLCIVFAHLGYVAVAPDYRVGFFFPNAHTTELAVTRCMHDLRGCVRYLRRSKVELGDPYRIDPDRILVGGISAGAVGAVHVLYLDDPAEIPPALYPDTASIGGLEGNSGSPGYSSDAIAGFSMSGALGDTSWIHTGDEPLCSLHEVGDPTVPYGTQEVSVLGLPTGLIASGSADIHKRLDHVGVPNCFRSYPGDQHVGYLSYDPDGAVDFVVQFMANVVCGHDANCGTEYVGIAEAQAADRWVASPNPTTGGVAIPSEPDARITVFDPQGRQVLAFPATADRTWIDLSPLPAGVYTVRCAGARLRVGRVVKE